MITSTNAAATLYVALELGCDKWVLASATQAAQKPRCRTTPARHLAALQEGTVLAFMANATRIDGCPGDLPGPYKTPADNRVSQAASRGAATSAETGHSFSPAATVTGERRGRMNAKTETARTRRQDGRFVSVDSPRVDGKSYKMPEWGLT